VRAEPIEPSDADVSAEVSARFVEQTDGVVVDVVGTHSVGELRHADTKVSINDLVHA
jgi:hypothetical protein